MAPPKRTAAEAHLFEDANPISKQKLVAQAQLAGRGRRGGGGGANGQEKVANPTHNHNAGVFIPPQQVNGGHASLKDLANMSEAVRDRDGIVPVVGLDWHAESRPLLLKYRDAYNLPARTLYRNPSAQYILASGIGPRSPTMAREKAQRRCTKDEVAAVARKHFKDTSVAETECLVEVMYRVKTKDKSFRLKFLPKPAS